MKKALSLLLACILVLAVVPSLAEETVQLSFLSWENETTLEPILKAFSEAHPNITIDLQYAPPIQDYLEKFRMLVSAGELPDVFVTAAENKLEVLENGLAADISDLPMVANLASANRNTYTDADGKLAAFAPDAWIAAIFYNKSILDANGIAVPTNYTEYKASLSALQAAGVAPWVFCATNLYDPLQGYVATETIANDPQYDTKVDAGELTYKDGWTGPAKLWYDDYIASGVTPEEALGLNGDQALNAFINGEACYCVGATWNVATIDAANPDMDYGMLPWFSPSDPERTWCTGAAGVGYSINAKLEGKKLEAARTLLEFMTSAESLLMLQKQKGSLLAVSGLEYEVHPVIKMCLPQLEAGNFYLPAVAWKHSGALGELLTAGSQEVLMGAKTPEELVQSFDDKWAEMEAAQ